MQPLLLRIDDRLLHAKVLVTWTAALHPARIVLASDAVALEPRRKAIYAGLSAEDAVIAVEDLAAAAASLRRPEAGRSIFVCASPADVLRLHALGGGFERVNLGGLHAAADRRALVPFAHLSRHDGEDLLELIRAGIEIEARELPGTPPVAVGSAALNALWQ